MFRLQRHVVVGIRGIRSRAAGDGVPMLLNRSGLKISARLLAVARVVQPDPS